MGWGKLVAIKSLPQRILWFSTGKRFKSEDFCSTHQITISKNLKMWKDNHHSEYCDVKPTIKTIKTVK